MKQNWEYKKLGEVCDFRRGLTYSAGDEVTTSNNCVLRSNNIDLENSCLDLNDLKYLREDFLIPEEKKLTKNSIFICMSNGSMQHIGKIAHIDDNMNFAFGGFMGLIVPNNSAKSKYVYYNLRSAKFKLFIEAAGKGANIRNLKFSELSDFSIPLPPLATQSAIVSELDSLSAIIADHKSLLKKYDELEQAIFYDMFGDPVKNEKGWEVKKLGDCCSEIKYGTSLPACENGKYKYIRMGNITSNGHLDLSDLKTIDVPDEEIEKCIVRYGDILFNRTNSLDLIGKTCMFDLKEEMVIAGYIIRVRLLEILHPRFISILFNLPVLKKMLKKMAKGAVNQANINSKELASIIVPIPPIDIQQTFASKIEAIEAMKADTKKSLEKAEELFNARMDFYFNA